MQNPFYKRMHGEAKAVLERRLKKAHHLRHLDDVGGQHVRTPNLDPKRGPILLGYGQNIQSDWNINAAEIKNFYPLTHQGSHAFHKNRRKGKRNLPLVDRFVKPSKFASWFVRIFKGAAFLKSDHPLQVSTHEQIINDLLNASSGSSSQNEIRVFSFSLVLVGSMFKRQRLLNIYICLTYIFI